MDQDLGGGTNSTPNPDDDTALRRLAEDLARDDPRLAALLDGDPSLARPRHMWVRLVLLLTAPLLVVLALLVPPTVAVGATAMLLAIASPLAVLWMCATDRPEPRAH